MNICPKCASTNILKGYLKYPYERIEHTCGKCGYKQILPATFKLNRPGYEKFKKHR